MVTNSLETLLDFENKFREKQGFIVGTGPSLAYNNLNKNKWIIHYHSLLRKIASEKIETGKYKNLLKRGHFKGDYNFKKLQVVSSFALIGRLTNDDLLKEAAKQQIFLAIKFQRDDGYFFTDGHNVKKDYARANVQFLCIELMNAYFNIKKIFNNQEKIIFKLAIRKSLKYVVDYISYFTEANQLAGALLMMRMYSAEFGGFHKEYHLLKKNLLDQQLPSGEWHEKWEAPGCDFLYLSLQLAYLARLSDFDSDEDISSATKKGIYFLKNVLLPSGEMDITASKRWIPPTPFGKKFFIYACAKFYPYAPYILHCLEGCDPEDIYYCTKAILQCPTLEKKEKSPSDFISRNFAIIYRNNFRITFGLGPIRISGGQITSIYHLKHGWITQQLPIGKHDLPSRCGQIRIFLQDGTILNSSLDYWAVFDPSALSVLGEMKIEHKRYMTVPFGHYRCSDAGSSINYKQEYTLDAEKITEKIKLYFNTNQKIKKIVRIIPLSGGKISAKYQIEETKEQGVYGSIALHNIILKKKTSIKKGDGLEFTVTLRL